jgi:cytoskeletal protein CcmA (bactofilin family)
MFSKKGKVNNSVINQVTIIGKDVQFLGDLKTKDDIRIEGNVTGCVISDSRVIIGPEAHIFGPVEGASVDVFGVVIGDIRSKTIVKIGANAIVEGDLESREITIELGAKVYGYIYAHGQNGDPFQKKNTKNDLSNLTLGETNEKSFSNKNSSDLLDVISKKVLENSPKSKDINNGNEINNGNDQSAFW